MIHLGDCLDILPTLPDQSIDLVLTSPPYDNLRNYNNSSEWNFNIFSKIAIQLNRVLKDGGVIVWIVNDATIKGSETGTSFKQALYFKDKCKLNLHDTMIYYKNCYPFSCSNRYYQNFEYMFIFCKNKIKTTNLIKVPTKNQRKTYSTNRLPNGKTVKTKYEVGKKTRTADNIWKYEVGYQKSTTDKIAYKHPAIFPEKLAHDHIISWSNKKDVVLDCFVGSGTTAKMCKILDRKFIGIEKDKTYFEIAKKRLANTI